MPTSRPSREEMAAFFDRRAEGYDAHMRKTVEDFDAFYAAVASAIAPTNEPVRILDLGAGTGAELEGIFCRAPQARVTAVDVSREMLKRLRGNHIQHAGQIELLHGSFTEVPFAKGTYDYVVSVMALHHHLPEAKLALYRKIHAALHPGGVLVNGDYVSDEPDPEGTEATLRTLAERGDNPPGGYHIDLPLPVGTEKALLLKAGFARLEVPFLRPRAAVLIARRAS